jgi:hypothetical protein
VANAAGVPNTHAACLAVLEKLQDALV